MSYPRMGWVKEHSLKEQIRDGMTADQLSRGVEGYRQCDRDRIMQFWAEGEALRLLFAGLRRVQRP